MQPDERNIAYLWDMREAARLIIEFTHGVNYAHYNINKMLQAAVERQLEIIGEAARRVSTDFQQDHPEIPWRQIIGLRNILAHEYGEVRSDRVWVIAQENIAELINQLDALIPPLEE